jgi:hypothetical protein
MARTVVKKKKNMKGRKRGGASVPCPIDRCRKDSRVVLTRRVDGEVVRNRVCKGNHAFTTVESWVENT